MFYVYALIDPINNVPFYIGKGKNKRAWEHLKGRANYNENKLRCIENIRLLGFEPEILIVKQDLTNSEALEYEKLLIEACNENGLKLTNKKCFPPDRTGSKLTVKHKETLSRHNKNKKLSDAHKMKIGESNRKSLLGRKLSAEHKMKIAPTEETKKKISLKLKGRPNPNKVNIDVVELKRLYIEENYSKRLLLSHFNIGLGSLNRILGENKIKKLTLNLHFYK